MHPSRSWRTPKAALCNLTSSAKKKFLNYLLGGSVPVEPRAGGSAALHLEINVEPIAKAYGSMTYKLVAGDRFGRYLHLRRPVINRRLPLYTYDVYRSHL